MSKAEAQEYLPPGANYRIHKDHLNGRWRAWHSHFDVSRSFIKWGELAALALCVKMTFEFESLEPPDWVPAALESPVAGD